MKESELQLGQLGPSLQPPQSRVGTVQGITGDEVKASSGRRQKQEQEEKAGAVPLLQHGASASPSAAPTSESSLFLPADAPNRARVLRELERLCTPAGCGTRGSERKMNTEQSQLRASQVGEHIVTATSGTDPGGIQKNNLDSSYHVPGNGSCGVLGGTRCFGHDLE